MASPQAAFPMASFGTALLGAVPATDSVQAFVSVGARERLPDTSDVEIRTLDELPAMVLP